MQTAKHVSRRRFMSAAAAATAAFTLVPRHVLGGPGQVPPSEKLNIAHIGIGGRGAAQLDGCSSENCAALIRLLIAKNAITPDEITKLVQAIDAEDGAPDGRTQGRIV